MKRKFTILIAAIMLITQPVKVVGQEKTPATVASFSRSGTTNTITGGTFSAQAEAKSGYYQDGSGTKRYIQVKNNSAYWTTTPSSITITAKIGGGTGATSLANDVYAVLLDSDGDEITSSLTSITQYITTNTGDTYDNISIPVTNNVYGVRIYHVKESGYNVRYYSFSLSYESGGSPLTPSNLAITGAPVALSFDLYDNSSDQTVVYTTSSTGTVTVSGGTGYVTTSLNTGTKTVTVTPNAVTPSAQTITISQAADENYAAGSVSFTVSVADSTPFDGVEFDATKDSGTSPISKDGVSLACDNGVLNNNSEYRLYKNSTTTISTNDNKSKITKIEFTGVSGNPASGFASQDGWTTSGNDGTWAGNATSVSFTASGAQVRATVIKVWVTWVPSISAEDANIAYNTTAGNIAYTLNHGADGSFVTATWITGDWLTVGAVGDESVAFTCIANNTSIDRTATVRLKYSEDENINTVVTVTQAGAPTYTVTYDSNGGTGTMNDPNSPYMAGATVTLLSNEFTKSGYIFNDWSISQNVIVTNNQFTMPASNVTVTAQWTAKLITELSYTGTPTKTSYYDGEYFDPTGLTITASYSNADDENVTSSVEWTPSPLINGTTSVTGTYMGHNVVISDLTVTYEPGTVNDPYTVAEAIAFINTLGDATSTNDVYVSGIISQVDSYNSTYNSITYWISDDGTTTTQMEVYSGKGVGGASFSAVTDLAVGDIVIVKGKVKKYQTTPEFVSNNQLYSLKHTVTYHINNGSGSETQAVQVEHGTAHTVIAKPDEWTYPGNTKLFVQWNTQDDGEGDNYAPDASLTVNENTDLYAVWDNNVWIISYTTNGAAEATTTNVIKGQTISGLLASPAQVVPAGYTFVGWSETEVTLGNTPTFVNNGDAISGNMSLLAVFAIKTESEQIADNYLTITNADFTNALSGSYSTETIVKTIGTTNYSIEVNACEQNSMCQMRDNATLSYVYVPTLPGNITNISTTECHNAGNSGYTGTIHIKNKKTRGNADTNDITKSELSNATSFSINMTGNDKSFYLLTSAGLRIKDLTITYRAETIIVTYSSYCTSVSDATDAITDGTISAGHLTTNGTIASDAAVYITTPLTINSNVTLTVNGVLANDNPANLIIEDGGQIIFNTENSMNSVVAATVKKETYAATAKDAKSYYWYAISSAVANPSISSATNIASGTYDLYRYNEAATATNAQGQILYWENYKAHNSGAGADFTALEKGRGYLYRNNSDLSIAMTGEINVADFNYSVTNSGGPLAGFNLIGNPYSHDIYKGAGTAISNGTDFLRTGFYYMEPTTGKWTAETDNSTAIKPNQGILVQTDKSGNIEMTNTNSKGSSKSNNDNIMFKVANSRYSDEAYAWFDKGRGLNKISHRNAEVPMLYINQDGENYAIATMSDDTKMFSLNFKAMTMGKYTLSYKTKGEFNYLHVIDRFTGEDVDMLLEGEYSFVASPSDSDARFIVKLAYLPDYSDGEGDIFAYQNGSDIFVSGEGELQIFDVMGRFVMSERINGVKTISADELSKGVYVLRLVGNGMKTQKIVVK